MRMETYKLVSIIIYTLVIVGLLLFAINLKQDIETLDTEIIVDDKVLNKTEDIQIILLENQQEIKADNGRIIELLVKIHNDAQQLLERSNDELNMTSRIIDSKHFE